MSKPRLSAACQTTLLQAMNIWKETKEKHLDRTVCDIYTCTFFMANFSSQLRKAISVEGNPAF